MKLVDSTTILGNPANANQRHSPSPLTSILTTTYNMMRHLPSAIQSVLMQEEVNWEYLILDDASEDSTWPYLQQFRNHSRIRLLKNTSRKGLTYCRNRLLKEAQGEFLSILDADDLILPWKVLQHAHALIDSPEAVVVSGYAIAITYGSNSMSAHWYPSIPHTPHWDLTASHNTIHSATTWRRSFLLSVGGYNPDWELVEGPALFLRAGDSGTQPFVPSLCALKRIFPDNAFRQELTAAKRRELSRKLLAETLWRRHHISRP